MSNPVGRPPDPVREAWMMRFKMPENRSHEFTDALMAQLSHCRSDSARRLILGVSEQNCTPQVMVQPSRGKHSEIHMDSTRSTPPAASVASPPTAHASVPYHQRVASFLARRRPGASALAP